MIVFRSSLSVDPFLSFKVLFKFQLAYNAHKKFTLMHASLRHVIQCLRNSLGFPSKSISKQVFFRFSNSKFKHFWCGRNSVKVNEVYNNYNMCAKEYSE